MKTTNFEQIFSEHILHNIENAPDKTAYIISGVGTTYAQMGGYARSIATALASAIPSVDDGSKPVRIGICLPRHAHYIPCIVATTMLHCSYVPIDVNTPENRKENIISDAGIDFMITEENLSQLLDTCPSDSIKDLSSSISEAYMIYTSGTSGVPKGVSISYAALNHFMQQVCLPEVYNISSSSVILQFASINFDASVLEIFSSLYWGGTLVIAQEEDRHDVNRLCNLIIGQNVTFALLPPSMLTVFPIVNFPSMDTLTTGGEAVPRSVTERFLSQKVYRYIGSYGPTENTVIASVCDFSTPDRWQCIGKPLSGVVCYVVGKDDKLVAIGEVGELLIGGQQVANGYWNRPHLNAKMFIDNPFDDPEGLAPRLYRSGDLVRLNADGTYDFVGRIDSQVKLHSHRIELSEITSCLEAHPRVLRAFTRLESLGNAKALVTYISTADKNPDLTDIRLHLAQHVPTYMVPTFWNHVDTFRLTLNGKIDKQQLVNHAWIERTTNHGSELSRDERTLMREVALIMGVEEVNIDADLIDEIGLSSINVMRIPIDLGPTMTSVSVEDIYKNRTIRRIANNHLYRIAYWHTNPEEHPERPVVVIVSGYTTFAFLYLALATRLSTKYNIFVIEGYHVIIKDGIWTTPEITQIYADIMRPVLERFTVAAYLGFCLGGEQALYLAHFIHDKGDFTHYKPTVMVIDGELRRDTDPDHFIALNYPSFTDEQNKERAKLDLSLMSTMPQFKYSGPVATFLCDKFTEQQTITPEEQLTISKEKMDYYRAAFERTPRYWREDYPDCDIIMLPGDHFDCLVTPTTINIVANYLMEQA